MVQININHCEKHIYQRIFSAGRHNSIFENDDPELIVALALMV